MKKANKIRKGGRGKRFEQRNREIVELRLKDPEFYSYGKLGRIYGIDKSWVRDIFLRDKDRYLKDKVGISQKEEEISKV